MHRRASHHLRMWLPTLPLSFRFSDHPLTFFHGLLNIADEVKGHFRKVIELTIHDCIEVTNSVFYVNEHTFQACKRFSNMEWLGKEALHPSCAMYHKLILVRKLIHTEDGNNVL